MNNNDILIDVQHVSKRFCKDLKRSMRYGFMDSLRAIAGRDATATDLRKDEFWAVKDVSFQLRRGECLGLIGHNGAGKSTLLKMLNGLINPDQGSITMRGKIGALIELGAGFNPILTGRENIYNNGAVLGFSRSEIDAKVEAIIDFAEIREFIDAPVQNYSSGMRVRLGFAVAAQMEPDILLIDEVLAVGDIGFVVKCLNRISELLKHCAVIFVTHNMPQVSRICTSGILMNKGVVEINTRSIGFLVESYFSKFDSEKYSIIGSGNAKIENFELQKFNKIENSKYIFEENEIRIKVNVQVIPQIEKYAVHAIVVNPETRPIAIASSLTNNIVIDNDGSMKQIQIDFPNIFSNGSYSFNFTIVEVLSENRIGETLLSIRGIGKFIISKKTYPSAIGIEIPSNWLIINL